MSNVIELNERLLERGGQMIMLCTCGVEDGFQAVVVQGKEQPVVMCLVCNGCEKEHYMLYGEITSTRTSDQL